MGINTGDIWFKSALEAIIVGILAGGGDLRAFALALDMDWLDIEHRAGVVWQPAPMPQRLPETAELRGLDDLNELDLGRFLWDKDQHERRMK